MRPGLERKCTNKKWEQAILFPFLFSMAWLQRSPNSLHSAS